MPDCTHADAGEAREEARREQERVYWLTVRAVSGPEIDNAWNAACARLADFTPCPDCGRWREGA